MNQFEYRPWVIITENKIGEKTIYQTQLKIKKLKSIFTVNYTHNSTNIEQIPKNLQYFINIHFLS